MDAELWERVGLYDPLDPTSAERLALLDYLTERGATIEQMVEAHRMGTLPGVAGNLVTQGKTPMATVKDIAEQSGMSLHAGPARPAGRRHTCRARHRGGRGTRAPHGCIRAGRIAAG